jgi:hypothetical protein
VPSSPRYVVGQARYLPREHVHLLRVPRHVSDFTLRGTTPGAAGLRCEALHHHLERWMHDYQTALDRKQPRAVPRQRPALELGREEHDRLERELADADAERAAAHSALQQPNAEATATAPPPPRPPHTPLPRPLKHAHDDATGCGAGYAGSPQPDTFWSMPPHVTTTLSTPPPRLAPG